MIESMPKPSWGRSGAPERMARPRATWLGLVLLLALVAGPAPAQVPQDMNFSGRLVDGAGTPLVGPVILDLHIYPAATGGSFLYGERHDAPPVPLDAQGNFSVRLGSGSAFFGSFDAALFSGTERYVEVVLVTSFLEFLTPRVPLSSVPWTLVAQQANAIVRDPAAPRFEDCGDGTVADHQTGLQWEKKTGTFTSVGRISCVAGPVVPSCLDPHHVNNVYDWSTTGGTAPDGSAFFLLPGQLNQQQFEDPAGGPGGCLAGHCDWRLPIIDELGTILIGPGAAPGQETSCSLAPCIDPDFAAIGGSTAPSGYWSASPDPGNFMLLAWLANFANGNLINGFRSEETYVRAVRVGSCD